ncbi:MAG: AAA family ATPase [Mariprofundaceae bacterium]|nr:AAA family ATPase [Mariprofundaceae bacterium]
MKGVDMHVDCLKTLDALRSAIGKVVIGQGALIDRLLIGLLAGGHLLLEGVPGLAKTTLAKAVADCIDVDFHRIQFTPDLLPGDLIGTDIFHQENASFEFMRGPMFHSILLADEINRSPAKVPSALLEAMEERQVTVGNTTYALPDLFWVIATQNPVEQEGTFPLPEAQIDRFLMMLLLDYPTRDEEIDILRLHESDDGQLHAETVVHAEDVFAMRHAIRAIHLAPELNGYIVDMVAATRNPERLDAELDGMLTLGASPRASIALSICARAHAAIRGRDYVSPHDIQSIAPDVLRHRIIPSFDALASGRDRECLIQRLIELTPVP